MARPRNSKDQGKRKTRTKWTPTEIQILMQLYPDHTNESIAIHLNKSIDSIKSRAKTLKLKKKEGFNGTINK